MDSNVVFEQRGASIYIEDGNEVNNTISGNAVGCEACLGCRTAHGPVEHKDSDMREQSGIYALSPSNHFLYNFVFNQDNALYVNQQGASDFGMGAARFRTCTMAYPFGRVEGNEFHYNAGFGLYLNRYFGAQPAVDAGGFVAPGDRASCLPFDLDTGAARRARIVVARHAEVSNDFAAGGYHVSGLTFVNSTFLANNKAIYLKSFFLAGRDAVFARNCLFVSNNRLELPGGSAMLRFENCAFRELAGGVGLPAQTQFVVNHHAYLDELTGSLGNSLFDLRTSHFDPAKLAFSSERTVNGAHGAIVLLPGRALIPEHRSLDLGMNARCPEVVGGGFRACPANLTVRGLAVYDRDPQSASAALHEAGRFKRSSQTAATTVNQYLPTQNGTFSLGYGFFYVVVDGQDLSALPIDPARQAVVFSHEQDDSNATVLLCGRHVTPRDARAYETLLGPVFVQASACNVSAVPAASVELYRQRFLLQWPQPCGAADSCDDLYSPSHAVVFDPECSATGGVGCNAAGRTCCRICGVAGYHYCDNALRDRPVTSSCSPTALRVRVLDDRECSGEEYLGVDGVRLVYASANPDGTRFCAEPPARITALPDADEQGFGGVAAALAPSPYAFRLDGSVVAVHPDFAIDRSFGSSDTCGGHLAWIQASGNLTRAEAIAALEAARPNCAGRCPAARRPPYLPLRRLVAWRQHVFVEKGDEILLDWVNGTHNLYAGARACDDGAAGVVTDARLRTVPLALAPSTSGVLFCNVVPPAGPRHCEFFYANVTVSNRSLPSPPAPPGSPPPGSPPGPAAPSPAPPSGPPPGSPPSPPVPELPAPPSAAPPTAPSPPTPVFLSSAPAAVVARTMLLLAGSYVNCY